MYFPSQPPNPSSMTVTPATRAVFPGRVKEAERLNLLCRRRCFSASIFASPVLDTFAVISSLCSLFPSSPSAVAIPSMHFPVAGSA